jgi:hypothetical protein
MLRSLARRERRPLWATSAFLFALGAALAVWASINARGEAIDQASADTGITARTELAPLLQPRDLNSPITGQRAEDLAAGIERSITSIGPVEEVRIFSALGRILYADEPRFVGTRPSYLRNLTFEVASGEQQQLLRDGRLQTYVPIWLSPGGDVAVAELSQPLDPIVSEATSQWYRIVGGAALLLLLSLGMVMASTRAPARSTVPVQVYRTVPYRAPLDPRPTPTGEAPIYQQPGFRELEEQRQDAERRAMAIEENFRAVQARLKDAQRQVKELEGRLAAQRSQTDTSDGEVEALRDQLRETSERLHAVELDNSALRERMALRNHELDEARGLLARARSNDDVDLVVRLDAADARATEVARQVEELEAELRHTNTKLDMTRYSEALRELGSGDLEIEEPEAEDSDHPVIIRNAHEQTTPTQKVR